MPVQKKATKAPKSGNERIQVRKVALEKNREMVKHLIDDEQYGFCIFQHTDTCSNAKGFKKRTEFYASRSKIFPYGTTPICKDCLRTYIMEDGNLNKLRFLKMLPIIDKPYRQDVFEMAEESIKKPSIKGDLVTEYMKIIAMPQYIDLTFSDSDASLFDIEKQFRQELNPYDIPITNELRAFWGMFLSDSEIQILQYNYEEYLSYYSIDETDPVQRGMVRDICFKDLQIYQAREKGNNEKDLLSAKSTLLKDANLTPAQTSKSNIGFSIGAFAKHLEEDKPILTPSDDFKDPDGILKIFMKFFGHITKMMGRGEMDES